MADSISWQELGSAALTQGISFLYGQAADLLRRWRDRKVTDGAGGALSVAPAEGVDQSVLAGELRADPVDEIALSAHLDEFIALTERLSSYLAGIKMIDVADTELTAAVEALRSLLELAYRQRITFRGEQHDSTGSAIDVAITAQRVAGQLTIARIANARSTANLRVRGKIDDIAPGGRVVGLDAGSIGD